MGTVLPNSSIGLKFSWIQSQGKFSSYHAFGQTTGTGSCGGFVSGRGLDSTVCWDSGLGCVGFGVGFGSWGLDCDVWLDSSTLRAP